jgi:rubredoxin
MFMAGRYDEYRKIPSATRHDEYEMEWVMVEEWQCSGCGFTECIDL